MPSQVQWTRLSEFLLRVGASDEKVPFCVGVLEHLGRVVPFDQGRVYLMDEKGFVSDEYLLGVGKSSAKSYREFYRGVRDSRYSATRRARFEARKLQMRFRSDADASLRMRRRPIVVIDWDTEPRNTRFYHEYVSTLGLTYTTGFQLFDASGATRALFCLDRTRDVAFSGEERTLLSLAVAHLDNMFRKLYAEPPAAAVATMPSLAGGRNLTDRERQLCTMIVRGDTPQQIADVLGISRRMVYKHLSNVHAKLGVSNQTELIARLNSSMGER